MRRNSDLAKIHIARRSLGMPEEAYRALLARETRKRSAAELDGAERARVIARFLRLGWRPTVSGRTAQRRKIAALLRADGKPAAYGQAIGRRMFGRALARCDAAQLRAVTAALVADRRRRAPQEGADVA